MTMSFLSKNLASVKYAGHFPCYRCNRKMKCRGFTLLVTVFILLNTKDCKDTSLLPLSAQTWTVHLSNLKSRTKGKVFVLE